MALPAVKRVYGDTGVVPRLHLVPSSAPRTKRQGRASSRSSAAEVARCRHGFRVACVVLALFATAGMLRVELTVRATEASLTASALRADIEIERIRGESLEVRRMALSTPERIDSIAGTSMGMGAAEQVAYIEMPYVAAEDTGVAMEAGLGRTRSDRVAALLGSIMTMTAGEAQVLLVGDAGLASSR